MPSFDIVNELNHQELANALDQARREIVTRYDFKNSRSEILEEKEGIRLITSNDQKMEALVDVVQTKMVRRGLSLKSFEFGKPEPGAGGQVKALITRHEGIEKDRAKELVKIIKDTGLKIQTAIEGEKLRVTGKNRDDLQEIIGKLRALDYALPLQFTNFRE